VPPLHEDLAQSRSGICLYGIVPPKLATEPSRLAEIAAQQRARFADLAMDGLILYDIQGESERTDEPRPFPFMPTLDPESYAQQYLSDIAIPTVVYRCVNRYSRAQFSAWLDDVERAGERRACVLVGAASSRSPGVGIKLPEAYELAGQRAPHLLIGGVAIAERHQRHFDEHTRMLAKVDRGCRFFVTQGIYDVTPIKSLLSDYSLALQEQSRRAAPLILSFSPCGSIKTLEFMKWLGISFPRWLENELRHSSDILERSIVLCERIFDELLEYGHDKGLAIGVNVESVSIRKAEIDASVELFARLRARMARR
jgi:5,10-methylenetetrahydrofolate reductase